MKLRDYNPQLQGAYLEAVENQLRNNDPPETRQTLDRLLKLNISERDAKLMIASVIQVETAEVIKTNKPFNRDRFLRNLAALPDQSFLEE